MLSNEIFILLRICSSWNIQVHRLETGVESLAGRAISGQPWALKLEKKKDNQFCSYSAEIIVADYI